MEALRWIQKAALPQDPSFKSISSLSQSHQISPQTFKNLLRFLLFIQHSIQPITENFITHSMLKHPQNTASCQKFTQSQ
jgi:hypothetical protein